MMGWSGDRHKCDLPYQCHGSVGNLGDVFTCDDCLREWVVVGRNSIDDNGSFYNLTFSLVNDYGDRRVYRSKG